MNNPRSITIKFEDGSEQTIPFTGEVGIAVFKGIEYFHEHEWSAGTPKYTDKNVILLLEMPETDQLRVLESIKDKIQGIINKI